MNQKEQDKAVGSTLTRTEDGQNRTVKVSRLPKTHADFWASKLRKRTYESGGKVFEIPTWQVRITHLTKEAWFNLDTANKVTAAGKARDIYLFLIANGWDATNAKFKTKALIVEDGCTVGQFFDRVKAILPLLEEPFSAVSREIYFRKFRSLVAGVCSIDGGKAKFDYVNGGHKKWKDKIHAVKLDKLTCNNINTWKAEYLEAAEGDPAKLRRAQISLNSILRSSKSLFTEEILKHLALKLPNPLPFDGVKNPKLPSMQYRSEIDPAALLQQAQEELGNATGDDAHDKHQMFKIILLAVGVGMRRDEIDTLQGRHLFWQKNLIRVETTEFGSVKTEKSEADIAADPALMALLKKHVPDPLFPSTFIISSTVKPRPNVVTYHHYRCARLFRLTNEWLKSKGIRSVRAIHTLRKEFGSQINAIGGLVAASAALRHSRITTTANHYVDNKTPTVFPLGKLMGDTTVKALPTAKKKAAA